MSRSLVLLAALLAVAACAPKRPRTALEYCKQLAAKHFEGKVECAPLTDSTKLATMQALEAATWMRRGPDPAVPGTDKLVDVGWVAYQDRAEPGSLTSMLRTLGNELAAVALLTASNERARVGVWVIRGEISADGFEDLQRDVAALAPHGS